MPPGPKTVAVSGGGSAAALVAPSPVARTAAPDASPAGPRRVVMLVNKLRRGGGAERVAVTLAVHLPRDRFDVTVVATRDAQGPLADELAARGVRQISLSRRSRLHLAPFCRFVAMLRRERVDVLHAHMF